MLTRVFSRRIGAKFSWKAVLVAEEEELLEELQWAETRRASQSFLSGGWKGQKNDISVERFMRL